MSVWVESRDGDPDGLALFRRHYTYRRKRDQYRLFEPIPNATLFVGPGEKLVLITECKRALFVWRKFISADGQKGVNCAVFRNEGAGRSSDLIREAMRIAWQRWPGERFYTYVNQKRVKSGNPGYCFLMAGWRRVGYTKCNRLLILEAMPNA